MSGDEINEINMDSLVLELDQTWSSHFSLELSEVFGRKKKKVKKEEEKKKITMSDQKPSWYSQSCAIPFPSPLHQVRQYPRLIMSTLALQRYLDLLVEDYSQKLRRNCHKKYLLFAKTRQTKTINLSLKKEKGKTAGTNHELYFSTEIRPVDLSFGVSIIIR